MHARRSLLPLGLVLLLPAPAALAQGPTGPTGPAGTPTPPPVVTVSPTPTPTAPPADPGPATTRLRAKVVAPHKADGRKVIVPGEKVRVQGRLAPAAPGERGKVIVRQGRKVVKRKAVRFKDDGSFAVKLAPRRVGALQVRVVKRRSAALKRATSKTRKLAVLAPDLRLGSSGPLVKLFTRGLAKMKYATPPTATFDSRVGRAVMAYRKVNGLPRAETTTRDIVRRVLAGKGGYEVRWPKLGKHVEADLSQQILALVDGKKLVRVYHTSSGAPATPTILGTYSFYSKTIGTNSLGMVDAAYFIRGYAIHGYVSVPPYNASHGCLRVPIPDARNIYDWIDLGDKIRVVP